MSEVGLISMPNLLNELMPKADISAITSIINANMESDRYSSGGDDDVEGTDGGRDSSFYEIGSNLNL